MSAIALLASSPASAQFACTTTPTDLTCTNPTNGSAGPTTEIAPQLGQNANANATTTNLGTAQGFVSETTGGGNATATNSGQSTGVVEATTIGGGNATATNFGSVLSPAGVSAITTVGGNATATNSGFAVAVSALSEAGGNATAINSGSASIVSALTEAGGNASATNSGTNTGTIAATTEAGGNATVINSGSNTGNISATAVASGNATATNSGTNGGNIIVEAGTGNATVINSGGTIGTIEAQSNSGNAAVTNSGFVSKPGGTAIIVSGTTATLTNIVGGRAIGGIVLDGIPTNIVNFQGGNWLFTISASATPTINTNGAPFVVSGNQIAVLDVTSFALADRALMNFTGDVQAMLQGRFDGMTVGAGGGGGALGFAAEQQSPPPGIANAATQAFSGIPSVAMSFASDARATLGKAPVAAAPYYDTTVWASGFGGERKQNSDGAVLPATDIAYGGALGIDRAFGPNLRLGAFAGGGASREEVELSVQTIDATYGFGGVYGRFDWVTQYLDFSLYGGGLNNNNSTRGIANNTIPSGFETATASYGGWFVSPEATYGYRIPVMPGMVATPRASIRYVGGALDGFSESGSMQNLSVGRRPINDLEERLDVELSVTKPASFGGTVKSTFNIGAIGLERLGNPTIDTVLLGQNLSFVAPGQASTFGGVLGAGHSIPADADHELLRRSRRHRDERSQLQHRRRRRSARVVLNA